MRRAMNRMKMSVSCDMVADGEYPVPLQVSLQTSEMELAISGRHQSSAPSSLRSDFFPLEFLKEIRVGGNAVVLLSSISSRSNFQRNEGDMGNVVVFPLRFLPV